MQSPEHKAKPRTLHQQLEPTVTSNIIVHKVYATSMCRTSVYTCFYQSETTYISANANLKLHRYFRLQSYLDHIIYRIKHASVFISRLSMIKPHNDNTFRFYDPGASTIINHMVASLAQIKQCIRSS